MTNPWGKTLEAQRTDLWVVDLSDVVKELAGEGFYRDDGTRVIQENRISTVGSEYVVELEMPELATTPEVVRRYSNPYQMPSWDQPIPGVRMMFVHETNKAEIGPASRSAVYSMLMAWRRRVRAGRDNLSGYDLAPLLGSDFKIKFRFDLVVKLLAGVEVPAALAPLSVPGGGLLTQSLPLTTGADLTEVQLDTASTYVLKNAWIGSVQLGRLTYDKADSLKISTLIYVDDIVSG